MIHFVGPFRIDAQARTVLLDGREVPLQPRVFDLLVYLARNANRVVSKDELLDALWPDVTVTESSLQRAVSLLRSVLRSGGAANALRSYPKVGYRLSVAAAPEKSAKDASDQLAAAARAVSEQRWAEAVDAFETADGIALLNAAELERWAFALECLGRPSDAVPLLTRAVAAFAADGETRPAAESAVALSRIHIERGENAPTKGWVARAEQLLDDDRDCREFGLTLWMRSRVVAFEGEPEAALAFADEAYSLARRLDDAELEALTLVYRGFYKLSLGQTRAGLDDQDRAAALALSSGITPVTGALLYCTILWSCRTFGDWGRAGQWTIGYREFCTSNQMGYSGACQLHRAEVLGVQGTLDDALEHVADAMTRLNGDAPWALGDAHRVLGDIHAAKGNVDAAMREYDKAHALGWDGEPGRAMLLLDQGDAEAACASLERALIGQNWWTLQRQGILLAHLSLAAAHAGRTERARALIDDLAEQAERWPMPSIRAVTNEASAVLARAAGDGEVALRHLYLARQLWTSIDSRYHAARVRLDIAAEFLAQGDAGGAATELRSAQATIEEISANGLDSRLARLSQNLVERQDAGKGI